MYIYIYPGKRMPNTCDRAVLIRSNSDVSIDVYVYSQI